MHRHHMHGGAAGPCQSLLGDLLPASASDPRRTGQMLQMCGEMLRAIGDVMVKHGKTMEAAATK
jgi:hypothetical protein